MMNIVIIKEKIEENLRKAKKLNPNFTHYDEDKNSEIGFKIKKVIIETGLRYKRLLSRNSYIYRFAKNIYKWLLNKSNTVDITREHRYISRGDIRVLRNFNKEEFIRNVYLLVLQREPDTIGFNTYSSFLQKGEKGKDEVIKAILFSDEALRKGVKSKVFIKTKIFINIKLFLKSIPILKKVLSKIYKILRLR